MVQFSKFEIKFKDTVFICRICERHEKNINNSKDQKNIFILGKASKHRKNGTHVENVRLQCYFWQLYSGKSQSLLLWRGSHSETCNIVVARSFLFLFFLIVAPKNKTQDHCYFTSLQMEPEIKPEYIEAAMHF